MVFQNDILAGAAGAGTGYTINQSIRFNDDDSPTLQRTFGSAGGNTWTFSCWMKRGNLGKNLGIFFALPSVNSGIGINPSDQIIVADDGAATYNTTAVFRDPSAWYHIVFTGNGTLNKVYVNNVLQTLSGSPNIGSGINKAVNHKIGEGALGASNGPYMDGYFSEIVFVDGTELSPTDFGETNDDGVWIAKPFAGGYGSNGFYITGEDSADLGADYSGNGNDFTSSGLTSDDQVTDTPTENQATLNPIWKSGSITLSNGNLTQVGDASNRYAPLSMPIPSTGKFYFEVTYPVAGGNTIIGIDSLYRNLSSGEIGADANGWSWRRYNGTKFHNASSTAYGSSSTGTGTVMVAIDADNGKIWFGEADVWNNSGDPAAGTNEAFSGIDFSGSDLFLMTTCASFSTAQADWAITEDAWSYTPPTGFNALNTANLPTPVIADGSKYFQTTTYTGAGYPTEVNQSGNTKFQPDFVWIKRRNAATQHDLFDAVRGVSSQLYSSLTNAEGTVSNAISFDADGFTAAADPITGDTGSSGNTFVGWQWLAANGTASNTDGSITSTVSANTTAGFSIITWTGNGTASATIGHGLSAAPEFFIVKNRSNTDFWAILEMAYYGATHYLTMPSQSGSNSNSTFWTNTAPTSSVITLGTQNRTNGSGDSMVGYAFHSVEGFSKVGKYTGNGSADGPFVSCNFRPAYILVKEVTSSDDWLIYDSTRDPENVAGRVIRADNSAAEFDGRGGSRDVDFLSSGFKFRSSNGTMNGSGVGYIFMAFAEHPFGGDGVAPVPAR